MRYNRLCSYIEHKQIYDNDRRYISTTIVKPCTSLSLLLKVSDYLHNVLSPRGFNSSR